MKWFAVATAGCLWAGGIAHAVDAPSLPSWEDDVREEMVEDGWLAGADLLEEPTEDEPLLMELPNPEEISGDLNPVVEVPEEFLKPYFAARPEAFLIDPQGLLNEREFDERLEFLNYHADDSSIDLFVYLIEGEQEFPSEVRAEEVAERLFNHGQPAAVLYYYLGAPQRSAFFLSPSLTDAISAPEQNRALESSVIQAFERTEPTEQLERFLVQMSIRIYWMERKLGGQSFATNEIGEAAALAVTPEEAEARPMKFEALRKKAVEYAIPAAVLFGAFLSALGLRQWVASRKRHLFPDFEVEPRLGGKHAAGIGAVISFANASQPPESQRDQMPDYLQRARPSSIG